MTRVMEVAVERTVMTETLQELLREQWSVHEAFRRPATCPLKLRADLESPVRNEE